MAIDISSGFYDIKKKKICQFLLIFPLCTLKITVNALTTIIFLGSFFKCGKDIHCLEISGEFDYNFHPSSQNSDLGPFLV